MADNIGPQQYQGGISGAGGTPQLGRYNKQIDPNGASQPANTQGVRVISGFGEGSAALAAGLNTATEAEMRQKEREADAQNQLWLLNAKSTAELAAQKMQIDAANAAQPGDTITPALQTNWKQYSAKQLQGIKDPIQKAKMGEILSSTGAGTALKAQAFDETQRTDYALFNFNQTIQNKAKLYAGVPYADIDAKMGGDIAEMNTVLKNTPMDPNQRLKLQEAMRQNLTDAANMAKIHQDPKDYLTHIENLNPSRSFTEKLNAIEGSAQNPNSSASGKYQFLDSTWLDTVKRLTPDVAKGKSDVEILALKKNDDALKDRIYTAFTQENRQTLTDKLGRAPTDGEMYLAHQQGATGAADLLNNPDAKAVDVVGRDAVLNNKGTLDMTAAQFAEKWTHRFDGSNSYVLGTYEQRYKWQQEAHTAYVSQSTLHRGDLDNRWSNAVAAAKLTGQAPNEPTEDEIKLAYPNNPDRAQQMVETLQDAHTYYNVQKDISLAPLGTEAQYLDKLKPQAGDADIGRKDRMYTQAYTAVKDRHEKLEKDPASYMQTAMPDLQQAYEAAADPKAGPDALDTYVKALNNGYDHIGLPQNMRSILPQYVAASIVDQLQNSKPDQVKAKMDGLQAQFGDHWHDVMGELVKNKLPPEYMVLAAVDDPNVYSNLAQGLQAAKDGKDFKAILGPKIVKSIDDAVLAHDGLTQLGASLAASGDNGATYSSIVNSMQIAAYGLARTTDATAAAEKAAESVSTAKYSFGFDKTRLPLDLADKAKDYANAIVENVKPTDLLKPGNDTEGPASFAFFKNGYWATTPNDDGIIRMDMYGFPVRMLDGSKLEYSYDTIRTWQGQPGTAMKALKWFVQH
jgi:hypothetical protein